MYLSHGRLETTMLFRICVTRACPVVIMSTISKRRRNKASVLASFTISKQNEPAYSEIYIIIAKRTALVQMVERSK
jgi:hypothetical protein